MRRRLAGGQVVGSANEWLQKKRGSRVDPRHRFNLQSQHRLGWEERAEAAVELLRLLPVQNGRAEAIQIADLGCGNERLRSSLSAGLERPFEYKGYDLHPQSERVVRFDVERDSFSDTFDVVFCLGLIEYLRNAVLLVQKLRDSTRVAIVSYVVADSPSAPVSAVRRKLGWRTDYSRRELEEIFEANGFECESFGPELSDGTVIWRWTAHS
jgi:Methyltransferase domain